MNRFSSHPNHENHTLYKGPPPQGLSEALRAGSFFEFLVTDPPRGGLRQKNINSDYILFMHGKEKETENLRWKS
jgi:hypothetical protein